MAREIHVLNGPNLNMLGLREPEIYGADTLSDIEARLRPIAEEAGYGLVFAQSNMEGGLVELIQAARQSAGIILNPAAYTHTSVAVYDALKMAECPIIELHLSNPHAREAFRHHSYVSPVATGVIAGFGAAGYEHAMAGMLQLLSS